MERERVTAENVDDMVRRAAPSQPLPGLEGASVQFVVPARAADDKRFANNLLSTRLFWERWLAKYAPTAKLLSFETYAQPWGNGGGCNAIASR